MPSQRFSSDQAEDDYWSKVDAAIDEQKYQECRSAFPSWIETELDKESRSQMSAAEPIAMPPVQQSPAKKNSKPMKKRRYKQAFERLVLQMEIMREVIGRLPKSEAIDGQLYVLDELLQKASTV